MTKNEGYALLVGVDDYSTYDASAGNPAGKSDLLGSRNDVLAFFRTCRDLDIPAANIRVLTSPRVDPSLLPGVPAENVGDATRQAIRDGAAWLADALATSGGAGFFSFSGHGDRLEGGELALCPADARKASAPGARAVLEGAIDFADLRRTFADRGALANLTCVVDACFSGAALDATTPRERRTLTLSGQPAPAASAPLELGERVIAAARPDQPAYQARFSGEHRGALSWAIGATLDQWSRVKDGGSTRVNLSYGELRDRAERLLDTLSFAQKPVLSGPDNVADLAFFQIGSTPAPTAPQPDAARAPLQLDPGFLNFRKYAITLNSVPAVLLGEVFAMHQTIGSYTAGNEYWNVNRDALTSLGASLTIAYTDYSTGTPSPTAFANPQSFVEPISLTWVNMGSTDPISGGVLYKNGSIYLRLRKDTASPPSLTHVTWYQVLSRGLPSNISPSGTFSTTGSVSVPVGSTGYYIDYTI